MDASIFDKLDNVAVGPADIIPNGTRVLVKRRKPQEKIGALFIPEHSQAPDYVAKVMAVGPDVTCCKPGDWIMLGRWNATSFKLLEYPDKAGADAYREYSLIDMDDIYGIINKDLDGR